MPASKVSSRLLCALVLATTGLVPACSDNTVPTIPDTGGLDGSPGDGGARDAALDTGPRPDTGPGVDMGVVADMGAGVDTGPGDDTGVDGGTTDDTGTADDAGTDAFVAADDSGMDAFVAPVDMGTDAFVAPPDMGTDMFVAPVDMGTDMFVARDMGTDAFSATPPTAYRVTSGRVISPHAVFGIPLILTCSDLTDTGVTVGSTMVDSLNTGLMSSIDSMSLNIVDVFRPLDSTAAMSNDEIYVNAACSGTPTSCGPAATGSSSAMTVATNHATGTCFVPTAADVNPHCAGGGTCTGGYAAVSTISATCFDNAERDITVVLTVGGNPVTVPLHHARLDANYSSATTLTPGVIVGWISAREAADVVVMVPMLGNRRLYNFLQAGGARQADSTGAMQNSSCNLNGGAVEDDRDVVGGVQGFWFFLNVGLTRVTWTGP